MGNFEFKDDFQIVIVKGSKEVDNAFSAPGAKGCGGIFWTYVDPAVDTGVGLPSAAGSNTAILESTQHYAAAEAFGQKK